MTFALMVTDRGRKFQVSVGERLRERASGIRSWLCIGLDPDPALLPAQFADGVDGAWSFCAAIVSATQEFAVAFKINFAFFEAMGSEGWRTLARVRQLIPPAVPVIADAKRGDIGNTARAYARAIYAELGFDAVTVSPYLGWDALAPFTEEPGRCALLLCKTSNPGSPYLQDLTVDDQPLYLMVARDGIEQHVNGEIGMVVGATYPEALRQVRALDEDLLMLVPGVGAQGADVAETIRAAANHKGENALIAVSRSILYASDGPNFDEQAAVEARRLARATSTANDHASG